MKRLPCALLVTIVLGAILASCGSPAATPSSAPVSLNVFAAASLTQAFKALAAQYHKGHSNVNFTFNFAGSQILEGQIAQGAPADLFASADTGYMKKASDAQLVRDVQIFAKNKLVFIVPASNPGGVKSLHDLAKKGLKIDLAAPTVPAGKYCRQVLDNLAKDSGYGPDYRKGVLLNVVSQEDNVEAVVQKVELGEADAGCVYQTDVANAGNKIQAVAIPDQFNVIAQYPIAVVKNSPHALDAEDFLQYVLSPQGQALLKQYHFIGKNG